MVALVACLVALQASEPFTASAGGYDLTVKPNADAKSATVTLTGPNTTSLLLVDGKSATDDRTTAWKIQTAFLPRSAKVSGLGLSILLGDEAHAVVVVNKGKITGDHALASFLTGKALKTAEDRLRKGRDPFDETGFVHGMTNQEGFHFGGIKGVALKRPPRHTGHAVFQGTVFIIGERVFFVRVGNQGYGWFDPVDGELLSTDVPKAR